MQRFEHYEWPFFEVRHRQLARDADAWIGGNPAEENDTDSTCRSFVRKLGAAGFLEHCVSATPDVRSIALLREVFAYHHGLADFAFVMQGLGSGPKRLPRLRCRSRMRVPMSLRCRPLLLVTVPFGKSMERKPGYPTAALPICT